MTTHTPGSRRPAAPTAPVPHGTARLGNGTAIHLTAEGHDGTYIYILCNSWGSTNGSVRAPRPTPGPATCKRCIKLAG